MITHDIKIRYTREGMEKVVGITGGDWIDLRCADDIYMMMGEFKLIPLGVAMELPKGYEALVIPRSSTFKNYHILLANSVGLIDESYCGSNDEWKFPAIAFKDTYIPKNTRICQFRIIQHQPIINLFEVDELSPIDRGGIGSTGDK